MSRWHFLPVKLPGVHPPVVKKIKKIIKKIIKKFRKIKIKRLKKE